MLVDFEALFVEEAASTQAALYLPFRCSIAQLRLLPPAYPDAVYDVREVLCLPGNAGLEIGKGFELFSVCVSRCPCL